MNKEYLLEIGKKVLVGVVTVGICAITQDYLREKTKSNSREVIDKVKQAKNLLINEFNDDENDYDDYF